MSENPFNPGYYDEHALRRFGFASVGRNVQVAKNCTIVDPARIHLGDHVRIDGYCTLIAVGEEASIRIGSYVHIAGYCHLSGGSGIVMEDFSGLSNGVRLYSRSDDYSGEFLTNPCVPKEYLGVISGAITLKRHVIVGAGSVVLPGATVEEGCAVGALSLLRGATEAWGIYAGIPAKRRGERSRALLDKERQLLGD